MSEHPVEVTVNGTRHRLDVPARLSLADLLREHLGLTGTHLGCEQGRCGSCTVLLSGEPVRGCLVLAVQADGAEVTTVEGVAADGTLDRVQSALREHHGLQCGFCTPGIVLTLRHLLDLPAPPGRDDLVAALDGHLCRCTGYVNILRAAESLIGPAPSERS
ncbi:(2Fe-2S)-binding protein [Parafrankia sp. EUN1f]|uniref:(2Fe-2S)-binding protein n=1 Tax=Parafrankia sp. EUN1f TaxID=102897 RepID=UPI0001C45E79|nr:(2Fe-2S)-binding protein [Parafrankia sp. EUN1f]EFC82782.1 (2Fe-2S)-binding domain protein [Parafrankia sp. EUN1f]